jgi:hypothetical protein
MLTGCNPRTRIDLHYLPGFVAGSQNVFRPVRVAMPPPAGDFSTGDSEVGAIYTADGNVQTPLVVANLPHLFNLALIQGLADAGLTPVSLDSNPADGKPPEGTDYILTSELAEVAVNKHFGAQQTIHGQYFTMHAIVRVKYQLKDRDGAILYSGEISGVENEPPNPVGAEVFLPLETEPAESLSVALSRAVGGLMIDSQFRSSLPLRPVVPTPTSSAPSSTPQPSAH